MKLFSVFAVDPGGTTGVAWGFFDLEASSVRDAFARGDWESWENSGTPATMAHETSAQFLDFLAESALRGIAVDDQHCVFEDFVLRKKSHDREMLDPVRVTAGFCALCQKAPVPVVFQQPSEAKSYATSERLKRWGAWVVGSEHRRDAVRHLALCVSNQLT